MAGKLDGGKAIQPNTLTAISNGTSNISISTANGSVVVGSGGNASILTITSTGVTATKAGFGNSGTRKLYLSWDSFTDGNPITISSGGLYGNAEYISANAGVKLTSAAASLTGSLLFEDSTIDWTNNITMETSLAATGGSGADGHWIVLGTTGTSNTDGSAAAANGVGVYIDFYNKKFTCTGNTAHVNFYPNGTYTPGGVTVYSSTTTTYYTAKLVLYTSGTKKKLDLYLNDSHQASWNIGSSWTANGNVFGVHARTGGANALTYCRNIKLYNSSL